MAGLLDDPQKLSLLLSGLGLLSSKTRSQADKWKAYGAQGLLQGARDKRAKQDKLEERDYNQPYKDAQLAYQQAQTQSLLNPQPASTSTQKDYELAVSQGYKGSFLDFQTALARARGTTINNNVGGSLPFKVPPGMMLVDPLDPSKGVKAIPGTDSGSKSGESAKTAEIARAGSSAIANLAKMNQSGHLDTTTLGIDALTPEIFNSFKSADAQEFGVLVNDLTDLIGRLRSGGAIQKDEEARYRGFLPKFGDKPETIKLKLERLNSMFASIGESMAPSGSDTGQKIQIPDVQVDPEYETLKKEYGL